MATAHQGPGPLGLPGPLSPAVGLLLMVLYAALAVDAGAAVSVKRDA